ncbi:MAG TPA: hypothetical protein PK079_04200 [Leptospiraceae bacterium]|nr:hypothetical protein [Leptospiraceae bacterium]HMX31412.1 hypothetical protein [Leptospiraceae bacterium]HMY30949.1 hypothetical protein [Leptospiraceae bacterium]HMZ63360.1 hypothetical protein [Leptospiraceae bacterium]HNA05589.1 hypothetical protein [Leptospiraceae bacterium]
MSSHSILLTNRGFKVFSDDFFVDIFSFLVLYGISIFVALQNLSFAFYLIVLLISSSLFYIFYKLRIGYIYYIGFFYQMLLYLLITPLGFLNWFTLSISLGIYFLFSLKGNLFYKFRFPAGLFLSLLTVSTALFLDHFHILKMNLATSNSEIPMLSFYSGISGLFLTPMSIPGSSFLNLSFSVLESLDLYLLILVGFVFLRQENFLLDLFLISVFVFLFSFYYRYDILLCKNKIINFSSLWYILFSAPGRSHHLSSFISLIVGVLALAAGWFLIQSGLIFPPILFIIIFFILYGFTFYLVTESIFAKNLLYRYIIRK